MAVRLAAAPVRALGAARALLLDSSTRDLAAHLAVEADSIAAAGSGAEGREGVAAFLERRKPISRALRRRGWPCLEASLRGAARGNQGRTRDSGLLRVPLAMTRSGHDQSSCPRAGQAPPAGGRR
jgi:hypothetical protein